MTGMARSRQRRDGDTRSQILDVAERLVQVRGFNGFSYADVAAELGISKPSLHYHFAGKAELGQALIERYASRFVVALDAIERDVPDARSRLEAYADIYAGVLSDRRMCLCGMLAAEYDTLPEPMREAIIGFFDHNEAWLTGVLEEGRRNGSVQLSGSAPEAAQTIVSSLEGALLIARPYGDVARFRAAADRLVASLAAEPPRAPAA
jgi:TetR/AcrR family transcriptional regulator, transcriptional repressor for nem operon